MGAHDRGPQDPSRRRLLIGGAATIAGLAIGCSGDDEESATTSTAGGASTTRPPPDLPSDPFTLGVASGDPRTDSVILWTRLALEPVADDGLGGMPDEPIDVRWEIATDEAFSALVGEGTGTAEPAFAHTVHVDAAGLDPATDYHYRFHVGEHTSPAGRTRTLPEGSPDAFGIAVVNCQWFETGAYAAYRHLLDEPIDLVVHLGDYIYEYAGATEGARQTKPAHELESLADYRLRYASYRLDEDLRAAHARFPFVLTWDDHEVSNNYSADGLALEPDPDVARARKTAAYRAWWEHLPVRFDPPDGPELDVHQALDVGDLARIYLLDQRQHADAPPCRGEATAAGDFGDCAARTGDVDRSLLGAEQEAWLAEAASTSAATWNLLGSPLFLAGVNGGSDADGDKYYVDSWDGFPAARLRLIELLAEMENPVVLTGDYHAGMVLDVHGHPFEDSPIVAPEFMAPAISSPLFPADVSGRTPHLRQQLNEHGYLTVAVEPERLTVQFRILDAVADPASNISTASTWTVNAGDPVTVQS